MSYSISSVTGRRISIVVRGTTSREVKWSPDSSCSSPRCRPASLLRCSSHSAVVESGPTVGAACVHDWDQSEAGSAQGMVIEQSSKGIAMESIRPEFRNSKLPIAPRTLGRLRRDRRRSRPRVADADRGQRGLGLDRRPAWWAPARPQDSAVLSRERLRRSSWRVQRHRGAHHAVPSR